jgi:hypothetical protein
MYGALVLAVCDQLMMVPGISAWLGVRRYFVCIIKR